MSSSTKRKKRNFRVGDTLLDTVTGRFYTVERFRSINGVRYLLRSMEAGNPGRPKSAAFIQLQIEDGFLKKQKPPKQE